MDLSCPSDTARVPMNLKLDTFTPPSSLHAAAAIRTQRHVARSTRRNIGEAMYSQAVPRGCGRKRKKASSRLPRDDRWLRTIAPQMVQAERQKVNVQLVSATRA